MRERIKNNKFLVFLLCLIVIVLILIVFRISYAYLKEMVDGESHADIDIKVENVYNLKFVPGKSLDIAVTSKTLPENGEDIVVTSNPRVELRDPDPKNTYNYYAYLNISNNPFIYTEEGTPEILLKIQKGEEEITKLGKLTYITDLQAFDITTFHGLIPIMENIEMKSNGTNLTTDEWTFTLTYRNLDIDQSINLDKSLNVKIIMQLDKILSTEEKLLANSNTENIVTLYHHNAEDLTDPDMANKELIAGDDSYRFSGSSTDVKNYVCLDGKTTGECASDDDLYRIIGLFKNEDEENEDYGKYEMKLIKASLGTTKELGDGEAKISEEDPTPSAYSSGTNYYWNKSNGSGNVNMWRESNLNKVNLNSYFYNYITTRATYLKGHITEHTWTTGGYPSASSSGNAKAIYDAELGEGKVKVGDNVCYTQGNTSTTRECKEEDLEYPAHIGLMYISDYMYATIPSNWTTVASSSNIGNNNWLKLGSYEWSLSRSSSYGFAARAVVNAGRAYDLNGVDSYAYGVRPVFYLTSDVKIKEGEGSKETPYRLEVE